MPVSPSIDFEKSENALRLAKALQNKNPDAAKTRLNAVIEDFPDTPAALEARKLLNKLAGE